MIFITMGANRNGFYRRSGRGYLKAGWLPFCLLFCMPLRAEILYGEVIRVWDGDSLHLQDATGQRHKIRLAGIDAPELEQPQGEDCRILLAERILRQYVRAEVLRNDRYGRRVAKISLNGSDIGRQQVAAGCAWHYRRFARRQQTPAEYAVYAAAELGAKRRHLGVWGQRSPQAPWQFRRRRQSGL